MKKSVSILAMLLLFYLLSADAVRADMGAILPVADVTVREPGQKAIIAHDGFEEILILGTDFETSAPTKALRFIPLPSEPTVALAPNDCFKNLGALLKSHNMKYLMQYKGEERATGAVDLRFHKRLGPHDVTVVQVKDAAHFGTWANEFFESKGLPERKLSEQEAELVSDYVKRGFDFFAFDLVELGPETKSIEPLLYRFPTRHFYYPLKTSNLFVGRGTIELFIFSDRGVIHDLVHKNYHHKQYRREKHLGGSGSRYPWFLHWRYTSTTALVTKEEIQKVAPEIAELMGKNALLRAFKYGGELDFKKDLWLKIPIHEWKPRPGLHRLLKPGQTKINKILEVRKEPC